MTATDTPKRSSKPYDTVKQLVEIVLPAAGTTYFALAGIWDLPNASKVVGSIACVTTFFGVCLKVSRSQYYGNELNFDGEMVVHELPTGEKAFSLAFEDEQQLQDLGDKKRSVEFKVAPRTIRN